MQAVASGEMPDFIQSQRMKTCKKGGEEGHRGEVKCTHSPFQSYLCFFHVLFHYIYSFQVHSFFNPSVFLFHPCFASFSSALFPAQSLLNPHLALLPASDPVPIC